MNQKVKDIDPDEEHEYFDDDYIQEEIDKENKVDKKLSKRSNRKEYFKNKMESKMMIRSLPALVGLFFVTGLFTNSPWSISHYKDYRNSTGLALIQKAEQSAKAPMSEEQMINLVQKTKSRSTILTYIKFLKE